MPPDVPSAGVPVEDASPDALRGRVHDLEGEVARLTLRVKDLQQQLWGRKAERGVAADDAPALSLCGAVDATLPGTLPEAVAAGATPLAASSGRAGSSARPGPKPLDPALPRCRSSCCPPRPRTSGGAR